MGQYRVLFDWDGTIKVVQIEVVEPLAITQSAYAQQENSQRLRKASRDKIAVALGISGAQLDF